MNIVNICPTCKESISTTPLVDILVTYQEDLTREEIYEQGWHKRCYPPAPALLAACEATITFFENLNSDGETDEEVEYPKLLSELRAAIAEADPLGRLRGE